MTSHNTASPRGKCVRLRPLLTAVLAVLASAAAGDLSAQIATLFPAAGTPNGITAGPDGNLWFTENTGGKIGRITPSGVITEFPVNPMAGLQYITTGPDGNLWFTEGARDMVGRITPGGTITEFLVLTAGSGPSGIVTGPDGNLWFVEQGGKIGRITTAGVVTEFPAAPSGSRPIRITVGPDGNLWFAEIAGNKIGKITTAGVVTEYPVLTPDSTPIGITAGPDGNVWFIEKRGKIGRITPAGVVTEFPLTGSSGEAITLGPDGRFWFAEDSASIGRMTLAGAVTNYPVPGGNSFVDITPGPDGNLWFADLGGNIGRITPGCVPNATTLCLDGERFKVTTRWRTADGSGDGQAIKLTEDSGYFWFFTPNNIEMIVKALNACGFNNRYWAFAGGLTNVEVTLTVTDARTGAVRTYVNPLNTPFQPIQDTDAFATCGTPGVANQFKPGDSGAAVESAGRLESRQPEQTAAACTDDATTLCLNNGRFKVTSAWRTADSVGVGFASKLTGDSGYFWFFTPNNIEMIVKALNACTFDSRYWVFAGGLTNVEVTLTVTDTQTGAVKTYVNPINKAFQPIQDTDAFATCP